jgi:hypothetical protein
MSMDHKAFVFDYRSFELELKEILEAALDRNEIKDLNDFISANIIYLKDPDNEEHLSKNWRERLENYRYPHNYGDFALTKFYDPNENIGLGSDWPQIDGILAGESKSCIALLGRPIGKNGNYFDPGKMGSYFQSLSMVSENKQKIARLIHDDDRLSEYSEYI